MSNSRSGTLHQRQLELLWREFPDVRIADLYELTYNRAHLSRPGDGRHYRCAGEDAAVCEEMWYQSFGYSGWASSAVRRIKSGKYWMRDDKIKRQTKIA